MKNSYNNLSEGLAAIEEAAEKLGVTSKRFVKGLKKGVGLTPNNVKRTAAKFAAKNALGELTETAQKAGEYDPVSNPSPEQVEAS